VFIGGSWSSCIAVSGSNIFAATASDGLHMVNVSNPDAPVDLGRKGTGSPSAVAVTNNLVYTVDWTLGFYVYSVSGTTFTQLGHTSSVLANGGGNMAIVGNRAYVAGAASGFFVVDI